MRRNRIVLFFAFLFLLATWQTPLINAAVSRLKTWSAAETLSASDLNSEFNNIVQNGEDLGWPATKAKDMDGQSIQLDGDQDTHITADTDDRIDFSLGGFDGVRFDGTTASSVNGFDIATQSTGVAPEIKSRGESNIGWELQDSNGNEMLVLGSVASAVNEVTITNTATGVAPTIGSSGESNIGWELHDSNGNEIVVGAALGSAVNEITIENAATGNAPTIRSTGEADIGLEFQNSDSEETLILASVSTAVNELTIVNAATGNTPIIRTTGESDIGIEFQNSDSEEMLILAATATSVNELTVTSAATGGTVTVAATGGDTDVDLNLVSKGADNVQINGVDVFAGPILATEQATTSGTEVDFTSIPAWVKRITVMLDGVSTDGTEEIMIQLGDSGGLETSGYVGAAQQGTAAIGLSGGFILIQAGAATVVLSGQLILTLQDSANNTWAASGNFGRSDSPSLTVVAGVKPLSGTLTQVRLTSTGTPDDFDAGAVSIMYE